MSKILKGRDVRCWMDDVRKVLNNSAIQQFNNIVIQQFNYTTDRK
jgi:hypothetical protein